MIRGINNFGFHPNTLIPTLEGDIKIRDLYLKKDDFLVWSHNKQDIHYELNKISIKKKSSLQRMVKIIFNDNSYLILSPNYPMISDNQIILAKDMKNKKILGFEKDKFEYINHYPSKMLVIEVVSLNLKSESYLLVGHTTNNCAIIPFSDTKEQKGIIVNI